MQAATGLSTTLISVPIVPVIPVGTSVVANMTELEATHLAPVPNLVHIP
jgi:hypothetical protein